MTPDLYLIRLHGGPLDGHRHPLNYVPLASRLEIPGSLPFPDDLPPLSRPAVYELEKPSLELIDGLPTMVLHYHFAEARAGIVSAAITRLRQWRTRLRSGPSRTRSLRPASDGCRRRL
jgi:hypothetical protein